MNKQIILSIIAGLVIFVVGGGVGVFYKEQKIRLISQIKKSDELVKIFGSKMVSPIIIFGQIKDISLDKTEIKIERDGEVLTIKTKKEAEVLYNEKGIQKTGSIKDLKISQLINAFLSIKSDYSVEITKILIIPNK